MERYYSFGGIEYDLQKNKTVTVGELKKMLDRFDDDKIVILKHICHDDEYYSSVVFSLSVNDEDGVCVIE